MTVHTKILTCVLLCIATILLLLLPPTHYYAHQADEGIYLAQTQEIIKNGCIGGLRTAAYQYVHTPHLHAFPHPLRPLHLWAAAPLVAIWGIHGLAAASILFFLLIIYTGYQFVLRWHTPIHALVLVALVGFAPLYWGLSRRALTDIHTYYWALLPLWLYAHSTYQTTPAQRRKYFWWFVAALCTSGLVKESNYFFVPMYVLFTLFFHPKNHTITQRIAHAACVGLLPLATGSTLYITVLNTDFFAIIHIIKNLNIPAVWQYGAGGWYTYCINFALLAPLSFILFLMGVTHKIYLIFTKKNDKPQHIIFILFYLYTLFIFSFLPVNVRYVGYLDWIHSYFAALFLVEILADVVKIKKYPAHKHLIKNLLLTLPIVCLNFANFNQLFIRYKIYEPLSYYVWLGQIYLPIDSTTAARYTTTNVILPEKSLQKSSEKSLQKSSEKNNTKPK